VVGKHPVATPALGALDAVQQGASPAEAVLELTDAAFAAGAPLHQPTKAAPSLDRLAGTTGAALAGNGDPGHAKVGQVLVDGGLAVATVGGDRPWRLAGVGDDPRDGGDQQRRVGWVADHDGVVEHDPVGVVGDLGLVAELDRVADAAL